MRFPSHFLRAPSVTRWVAATSFFIFFIRIVVLFCESYSAVRSERVSDNELLELCHRGAASDSTKFRQLCLKTRSDRAAPLIFKAILKAAKSSFLDFTDSVNSPAKIALLLLFCLSGLALPIVKAISSLATAYLGPNSMERHIHDEDQQDACEVVVLTGNSRRTLWPDNISRRFPGNGRRRLTLNNIRGDDDDEQHQIHEWSKVCLGA